MWTGKTIWFSFDHICTKKKNSRHCLTVAAPPSPPTSQRLCLPSQESFLRPHHPQPPSPPFFLHSVHSLARIHAHSRSSTLGGYLPCHAFTSNLKYPEGKIETKHGGHSNAAMLPAQKMSHESQMICMGGPRAFVFWRAHSDRLPSPAPGRDGKAAHAAKWPGRALEGLDGRGWERDGAAIVSTARRWC